MILFIIYVSLVFSCVNGRYQNKIFLKNNKKLYGNRGGFSSSSSIDVSSETETIEIKNSNIAKIDGKYLREQLDINGRPHYSREIDDKGTKIHLYWSSTQWVLHYDINPSLNFNNLLAYAKIRVANPKKTTSHWYVKQGKSYLSVPKLEVHDMSLTNIDTNQSITSVSNPIITSPSLICGIPARLFPLYMSFMCDAIAVGLAMPLLPFYVMELGANAFQLSLIISSNYIVQMIGCLVIGQISDKYGRKLVLSMALFASFLSFFGVSQSSTLLQVTLARIVVGSCGGLVPIIQSSVADVTTQEDRPKYFARIMATYGLGFVLGPALSAVLPRTFTTKQKLLVASMFPLTGFLIQLFFFNETKQDITHLSKSSSTKASQQLQQKTVSLTPKVEPLNTKVLLLLVNGFLLMYAFSIETIYAMFIKDNFGYGERALSTLFACNGVLIGIFQVFFIKPLVGQIGKHWTLIVGNALLAGGMVGLSLIRNEPIHFSLFVAHIVGYSIADTALASLISKYSSPSSQGRDLAYNQAAQACARVISPLVAGLLYEVSKKGKVLPVGALPYLVGALFPAIGIIIPCAFYTQSVHRKKKQLADDLAFENGEN